VEHSGGALMINRKRTVALLIVFIVLAFLAWLQFRTWSGFAWSTFWQQTRSLTTWRLTVAILLIYTTYLLRAVRWKVLLKPLKAVPAQTLVGAQVIGFTAVAVLGRPADLVRPYIVARRHAVPLSSQLAIFAVERIFDVGCFTLLLMVDLLFARSLRHLPYYEQFRTAGLLLSVVVIGTAVLLYWIWRASDAVAERIGALVAMFSPARAERVRTRVQIFGDALHTIHDFRSLMAVFLLSLAIWLIIGLAYVHVMNAYPAPLAEMRISHVLLAMSASIAGSLLQLPMVGGGSQLGTIAVMEHVLRVPRELAASCGIMLWLITFAAVVPVGLLWTRFERVTLRKLHREAESGV
jgi:uncharacterized protein (TIRG00374 family)